MRDLREGSRIRATEIISNKGIQKGDLGVVRKADGGELVAVQWDRGNYECLVAASALEAVVQDDPLGVEDAEVVPVMPTARTRVKLMQNPEARDLEMALDDGWEIGFEQFVPMPREDLKGLMGVVYCVRLTKDEIVQPTRPKPIRSAAEQKSGYQDVETVPVVPVDQPEPEPEKDTEETGAPDPVATVVNGPFAIPFEEEMGDPPAEKPDPAPEPDQPDEGEVVVIEPEDEPVPAALGEYANMTFSEALAAGASGEILKAVGTKLAVDKAKDAARQTLIGTDELTEPERANLRRFRESNRKHTRMYPRPYVIPS